MTKVEIEAKLKELGIEYDPALKKADLEALLLELPQKEVKPPKSVILPSNAFSPEIEAKFKVKLDLEGKGEAPSFDGPGVAHWPYGPGTKAETMYKNLCAQPKLPLFIPLDIGEKFGTLDTVQLNGLKVVLYKGVMIYVPEQIAQIKIEQMNIDSRITSEALTAPNPFTGIQKPARLDLQSEKDQEVLS